METPTTFDKLMGEVFKLFPDAIIDEDEDGEIVISTGLTHEGDNIVEMPS